jgi:phosphoserine phosphatase
LRQAGHAVVVDPDRRLLAAAECYGWESIFSRRQPV